MIKREKSLVKAGTSDKRFARCIDLTERHASRLAEDRDAVRGARLQYRTERQSSRLAEEKDAVREYRLQYLTERNLLG